MMAALDCLNLLYILRVEHRDQFRPASQISNHIFIQFHPIETPMFGVRVNTQDSPFKPAFAHPKLGIKKDFHAVADVYGFGHPRFYQPRSEVGVTRMATEYSWLNCSAVAPIASMPALYFLR